MPTATLIRGILCSGHDSPKLKEGDTVAICWSSLSSLSSKLYTCSELTLTGPETLVGLLVGKMHAKDSVRSWSVPEVKESVR